MTISTGYYSYSYDDHFDGRTIHRKYYINIVKVTKCFISYQTVKQLQKYATQSPPTRVKVKDGRIKLEDIRPTPLKDLVEVDENVFHGMIKEEEHWNGLKYVRTDDDWDHFISDVDNPDLRQAFIEIRASRRLP